MILKCRCGKQYTVNDMPAGPGKSFKCQGCGRVVPVPAIFIGQSELGDDAAESVQLADASDALTDQTADLDGQMASPDSVADHHRLLRERDQKIARLGADLDTARIESSTLLSNRDRQLREFFDEAAGALSE